MSDELNGKTIAILAADGVEQVELDEPRIRPRGRDGLAEQHGRRLRFRRTAGR